ncbi:hypothetical protein [Kriegella aquimaris]|uniref:Uncharacterized protein n=1 Tax=Kriegella aquimaris TaxID=192904 RepID=A0A1G9PQG9_9FLAO|nr:hypothetical protein [Kriegella aquimaris]SDM01078.1 hypothetical protein SAMN04488514_104105 [Kriegella aquimaris]
MAPSKFEKHIKKTLQEREIRPSANAWDRISGQLEASEKPKSKGYYWYGIAASIIGLLLVSVWYLIDEKLPDAPQIVVKEKSANPATQELPTSKVVLEDKTMEDNTETKKIGESKNTIKVAVLPEIEPELKKPIAIVAKPSVQLEKLTIVPKGSDELINSKINEIAVQVGRLEMENRVVTDGEIDALLLKAHQEILENNIFRKDSSVDAMALLADVENELDKSFRDEIFDALKNGLLKVRTAVADRNK